MNRKEYALVSRVSSSFGEEASILMDRFHVFIDEMRENEERKLDSLPESLEGTKVWSSIEDAIERLYEAQDALDEMYGSLDAVMEALVTTA